MERTALVLTRALVVMLVGAFAGCTSGRPPEPIDQPPSSPPGVSSSRPAMAPGGEGALQLHAYLDALAREYRFSGAVMVAQEHRVLLSAGEGWADEERQVSVTAETRFAIASATKPLTATALMLLIREGSLELADPVCVYVPACPVAWQQIRIGQLLSHTSGLQDLSPQQVNARPLIDVVSRLKGKELLFPPGTDYAYANSNYYVVGYLIQRIAGASWPAFLRQRILEPLGMNNTIFEDGPPERASMATGFMTSLSRTGEPRPVTERITRLAGHETPRPDPAGGLISTVGDLLVFLRALDGGDLVPPPLVRKMWMPVGAGRYADYGLGWESFQQNGALLVQHGGGMPGFSSCLSLYPREDLYVIVLSNVTESVACEYIARDLGAIVLGTPYVLPEAPPDIRVPSDMLEGYAGLYEGGASHDGPPIQMRLVEGDLVMRGFNLLAPPLNTLSILRPWSETEFFNPHDPYVRITFDLTEQGAVAAVIFHLPPYKRLPATDERFVPKA